MEPIGGADALKLRRAVGCEAASPSRSAGGLDTLQSVLSLASPQEGREMRGSWLGEAELKAGWTKPPVELDAKGVQ